MAGLDKILRIQHKISGVRAPRAHQSFERAFSHETHETPQKILDFGAHFQLVKNWRVQLPSSADWLLWGWLQFLNEFY